LFWENQYQVEFDATITKIIGNSVVLDTTGFYPQGGGQVGDTGYLNGIRVVDTQPGEETDIAHILEIKPFFSVGALVHGKIDWERRYKIMRLHSAAQRARMKSQRKWKHGKSNVEKGRRKEEARAESL
jgi:Ser-tRNA(Ala) deacylase AlaX